MSGTSPVRRARRTKAEMAQLRSELFEIVAEIEPATVRGIFYVATTRGIVPKDQNAYKAVSRVLTDMRMAGDLPFEWIVDNTRWQRRPDTFDGVEDALKATAMLYRRNLWTSSDCYVEVWCEKDALSGVLYDVTETYDVPLMVNRGFSSVTYLHEAAMAYRKIRRPTWIYYFGDSDTHGIRAERAVEEKLRTFASEVELHFARAAVTPEQIDEWDLPTRWDKVNTSAVAVELDAIPPDRLRDLVAGCIERHVDPHELAVLRAVEQEERRGLLALANRVMAS